MDGLPNPLDILYAQVPDDEFDAQLVAYDSATGFYAWYEQMGDNTGNLTNVPGFGIVGAAGGRYGEVAGINGGTRTWAPAKTYNGEVVGGLPKYVRLRKRSLHDSYGPVYEVINAPAAAVRHFGTSPGFNFFDLPAVGLSGSVIGTDAELAGTMQFTSAGLYYLYGIYPIDITGGVLAVTSSAVKLDAYFVPQSADLAVYPTTARMSLFSTVLPLSSPSALVLINPYTTYCRFFVTVEVFSVPAAGHADMKMHLVFFGPSGSGVATTAAQLYAIQLRAGA